MASTIEERILEMRFNNSNFEKNAKQSIDTLDKLDNSLKLTEGSRGLISVESILEQVSNKFSILGTVGDQVIRRLTDSIMSLVSKGGQLVKSLTIDQVTAGWGKYAEKTSAVQTIMAATAKDWDDTGKQMEFVNGQLNKLNWFTDETSYSFLDMVNNIGKFTSNNVKLEDAVTAMEGISTWAAISGANVNEAGRAMYNLSQAMAVGSVKLMDWKSIENANMATREFKETVLATAVAEGTLTQQADGMYKTLQGHLFTAEQFNTQLSDGWFSSKVLMKTLDQYGAFSNKLQEVSDDTNKTATELLLAIKKYKETGKVIPELQGKIEELAGAEYDLGLRAFQAAQEAKTFREAIGATKDAVSTGWMNTFETIFGNYEEAKSLWTDFANGLYEVFAESGNARNDLLWEWADLGGRDRLLKGIYSLGGTILTMIDTVKEAFRDIFPKKSAEDLLKFTKKFSQFLESLEPSEDTLEKIKSILHGLFSILDIGRMLISSVYNLIKSKLGPILSKFRGNIFDSAASLGDWITNLRNSIKENNTFTKGLQNIESYLKPIVDWLKKATDSVKDFLTENLKIEKISSLWESLKKIIEKVGEGIGKAVSKIKEYLTGAFGEFSFSNIAKVLGAGLAGFLGFKMLNKKNPLEEFLESLKSGIEGIGEKFSSILDGVGNALQGFTNKQNADALQKIAIAVAILAASLTLLAMVDSNKLGAALLAVTASLGELIGSLKLIGSMEGKFKSAATTTLIKLAAAVLILAIALKTVADLDLSAIGKGLLAVAGLIGVLIAAIAILNALKIKKVVIAGVVSLAVAVGLLAGVVYLFSKMDPNTIGQGFLYMALTLGALTASLLLLGTVTKGGKMLAAGIAMIAIAAAVLVLAAAIAIFGAIPYDNLVQGLTAFVAILLASVAALVVLSALSVKVLAAAAALLVFAVAIDAIAVAVLVFALLPLDNLVQGILGMTAVLIVLIAALVVLGAIGPVVMIGAAAMLVLSAALLITAAAMVVMAGGLAALNAIGAANILAIAGALAVLGPALILLGAGCLVMSLGLVGAAALLVLGVALNTLVGIDLLYIAGGCAALGLALVVLAAGGIAIGLASVGLLAGSVALAALGLAMVPFAMGLHQLDDVDKDTILKFLEVLAISVAALAGLGLVAEAFAAGFAILGGACLAAGSGIALAGEGIKMIVDSILRIPDDATGKLKEMAKAMAEVLLDKGKEATNALEKVMKDLIAIINKYNPEFISAFKEIGKAMADGLKDTSALENAGKNQVDKLLSAIQSKTNAVSTAFSNLMQATINVINNNLYAFENAGANIAIGIGNGIYAKAYYPINAMSIMSQQMYEVFRRFYGIHSPSKLLEKEAGFIPMGAAKGIDEKSGYAEDAMEDMGDAMITALSPALAIISGLLDGSMEFSPTIRPVVDMSDVYSGASEIGSLFSTANVRAIGMAGSINSSPVGYENGLVNQNGSGNTYNPTINIYTQKGQNVNEIADAVERKLSASYKQRRVAGV